MTDQKKKRGRGRPAHVPTEKNRYAVQALSGYGAPHWYIAKKIGVCEKVLRKHYRDDLDFGMEEANVQVKQSLFKKATGDGPQAVGAAIYWTKARCGWKETNVTEHSGLDGNPIETISTTMTAKEAQKAYAATLYDDT